MLSACPTAEPYWQEYLKRWDDEDRGHFNDVAEFAAHVVESYFERGSTEELPAFFAVLERMLVHGDERVQELATIRLIEDIQNSASGRKGGAAVFAPWLGTKTKTAWQEVNDMWEGVGSLADMVRREAGGPGAP